jgi:hypothetical protein
MATAALDANDVELLKPASAASYNVVMRNNWRHVA